jgi:hypothetical protein
MQVNSANLRAGTRLMGANGKLFTVGGSKATTDWKHNVAVGTSILKSSYVFAWAHAPHDVVAATYARYNAGGSWGLFRTPGTQVYLDVRAFLKIYNGLSGGP